MSEASGAPAQTAAGEHRVVGREADHGETQASGEVQGLLPASEEHADVMLVANLQVKNVPDDLHAALRERAAREGPTVSDVVPRMLRRELALPSMTEWLEQVRRRPMREHDVEIGRLMDEVRDEFGA